MRRAKIVCTLGPATTTPDKIRELVDAGMNVARLNFSHGTHQVHEQVIERVRAISARLGYPVAILQDLQGPKIRTGPLQDGKPITLFDGKRHFVERHVSGVTEAIQFADFCQFYDRHLP